MFTILGQQGRRIVITGSNSGTGKEATRRLAAAGAEIVMAVRSVDKGEAARRDILAETPKAVITVRRLDLADLESVRAFALGLIDEQRPIDTLINNAGVMTPPHREVTKDGFELQFGSNFLGPFALTNLLLPLLIKGRSPRVVTMTSSAAHTGRINYDDPQWLRSYSKWSAYSQSKLADMLMGLHLATLSAQRGWGVLSTLAHPGYTRTNLQTSGPNLGTGRESKSLMLRLVPSMDVVTGTESLLRAAADPGAAAGIYYGPRWLLVGSAVPIGIPKAARREDAGRLWALGEQLTGVTAPA